MALICERIFAYITTDPDTMTIAEALRQPDRDKFLVAMHKELNDHISRGHWTVLPTKNVPSHKKRLPMVWTMKRKRNPIGGNYQVEGQTLCWWPPLYRVCRLLGYVFSRCFLANDTPHFYSCCCQWMAHPFYWFCHGFSSSRGKNRYLYDTSESP